MKTSDSGIKFVKEREGVFLTAYLDPIGIPTIGAGHIKGVRMGQAITMEQADALLREDLQESERAVNASVTVPLTQNQFDALVSFVFNLGEGNFKNSTLLRLLNQGDYKGAAGQFERWVNAGGKPLAGLVARRKAEAEMFLAR